MLSVHVNPAAGPWRTRTLTQAAGTNRGSAFRLAGVKKTFNDREVLKGLDLDVGAGEFVSLVGPSGCGKTTTLNILAGFVDASAGEVFIDHREVTRLAPHKRGLGMVFQSHALFPHMTIFDNVAF